MSIEWSEFEDQAQVGFVIVQAQWWQGGKRRRARRRVPKNASRGEVLRVQGELRVLAELDEHGFQARELLRRALEHMRGTELALEVEAFLKNGAPGEESTR